MSEVYQQCPKCHGRGAIVVSPPIPAMPWPEHLPEMKYEICRLCDNRGKVNLKIALDYIKEIEKDNREKCWNCGDKGEYLNFRTAAHIQAELLPCPYCIAGLKVERKVLLRDKERYRVVLSGLKTAAMMMIEQSEKILKRIDLEDSLTVRPGRFHPREEIVTDFRMTLAGLITAMRGVDAMMRKVAGLDAPAVARGIYVASRASVPGRAELWRKLRAEGWPIVSTWIDEDTPGQTDDFGELWARITREVTGAVGVVLYVEPDDFPLKGALVEAGMALAVGRPVVIVAPSVHIIEWSCRPIGSWMRHPLVSMAASIVDAFRRLGIDAPTAGGGEVTP